MLFRLDTRLENFWRELRKDLAATPWLTALSAGLIFGGICGIAFGWRLIASNKYIEYGLYRLVVLVARENFNRFVLLAVSLAILIALGIKLARQIWRCWIADIISLKIHKMNNLVRLTVLVVSAGFFLVTAWIANRYYLPYRFAPISLFADVVILQVTQALARFAMRLRAWRALPALSRCPFHIIAVFFAIIFCVLNLIPMLATADLTNKDNIILISIDTLRYDGLGVNGSVIADITPNLDRFARQSINFRHCTAQAPWTLPSHMSMLTSLYSQTHRMDTGKAWAGVTVDPAIVTLAEILRNQGYSTHALTGGGFVGAAFGFSQGFENWEEDMDLSAVIPRAKVLLEKRKDERVFLFLHTYDVHAPYTQMQYIDRFGGDLLVDEEKKRELADFIATTQLTPKRMSRFLDQAGILNSTISRNLYLGGINHMDGLVGGLLRYLEESKILDDTVVIFTSDHGEEFGEHNPEYFYDAHAQGLFEETVRVPLIVHLPRDDAYRGREVDFPAALVDIVPTLLGYLGIEAPSKLAGTNLLDYLDAESRESTRSIFSETNESPQTSMKAVRTARYKYIKNESCKSQPCEGTEALYDLVEDPEERKNIINEETHAAQSLRDELESYLSWGPLFLKLEAEATNLDAQSRERLRALGYVD